MSKPLTVKKRFRDCECESEFYRAPMRLYGRTGSGEETVERTAVTFIEKRDEGFECFALLAEIARGTEVLG